MRISGSFSGGFLMLAVSSTTRCMIGRKSCSTKPNGKPELRVRGRTDIPGPGRALMHARPDGWTESRTLDPHSRSHRSGAGTRRGAHGALAYVQTSRHRLGSRTALIAGLVRSIQVHWCSASVRETNEVVVAGTCKRCPPLKRCKHRSLHCCNAY